MNDIEKGFLYFFMVIITIAVIAVYITFFVGVSYIFSDPLMFDNAYLKNLTISFLVITGLQLIGAMFIPKKFYYLHNILLIVNLALIVCIWIELNNTKYNVYVLPLLVVYTTVLVLSIIMTIVYESGGKSREILDNNFLSVNNVGVTKKIGQEIGKTKTEEKKTMKYSDL